jgi:hypothetical protein
MSKANKPSLEAQSLLLQKDLIITIWKDKKLKWITAHGEGFEIIGLNFKFKEGDEIHITSSKELILEGSKEPQSLIEFKIKREGNFLKNSDKKKLEKIAPEWDKEDDIILEFNGVIFIHRFEGISNLREVISRTKDEVSDIVTE